MKAQAQRMIGTLVLALATAAVVIGSAQAQHPNDRAGMLGVGGVTAGEVSGRAVVPNDRGGMLGVGAVLGDVAKAPVRPDDRPGIRGPSFTTSAPAPEAGVASRDEFQWDDATLGAATTLGVLLLLGAVALTIRRRGRLVLR